MGNLAQSFLLSDPRFQKPGNRTGNTTGYPPLRDVLPLASYRLKDQLRGGLVAGIKELMAMGSIPSDYCSFYSTLSQVRAAIGGSTSWNQLRPKCYCWFIFALRLFPKILFIRFLPPLAFSTSKLMQFWPIQQTITICNNSLLLVIYNYGVIHLA